MKKKTVQTVDADRELAPLNATRLADSGVPTRVRIAPWGRVESTSGTFVVDEESARLVLEAFEEHGTDLPIDYEHQTLGGQFASPSGQAPAAGWIKSLEVDPDEGIFALVEWTEPAIEQLAAKQYRYLSPVAVIRRSDRKLIGLHSVALTNKPAIVGAEPIINRVDAEHAAPPEATLAALRQRLAMDDDCATDAVLLAASRRLETLEQELQRRDAEQHIGQAVREGKITEAQRGFAMRLALSDASLFDEWLRTAPVVVPLGRTTAPADSNTAPSEHRIEAQARAEYRAHPELAALTTEDAFVADALRKVKRS